MFFSRFLMIQVYLAAAFSSLSNAAPYTRFNSGNKLFVPSTSWQQYVRGPSVRNIQPVRVLHDLIIGDVTNPDNLLDVGGGVTILHRPSDTDVPPCIVLDFGIDVVGFPKISFASGSSPNHPGIKIAFSETLGFLSNRSDFTRSDNGESITNGTDQIVVLPDAFEWMDQHGCADGNKVCADGLHGFRYMKISLDAISADAPDTSLNGTVQIDSVSLEYSAYIGTPDTFTGWFECSDPQMTQFWYDGVYTNDMCIDISRANDTDPRGAASATLLGKLVLMDGAKRDREPYVGDLAVSARTAYLSHDISIAARNVLADLADHQRADGWIPPASMFNYTLPLFDYPLWWVVCSRDLYLFTGDEDYAAKYYPNLVRVLDLFYPNNTDASTGLLARISDYGDYGFLPRSEIVTYINALYIYALRNAASIATFLGGHDGDAKRWALRAQALSVKLNLLLWDSSVGAYLDTLSPNISHAQDGNSLAILSGAASPDYATAALNYLDKTTALEYGNAFYDNDLVGDGFSQRVYAFISYFEIRARFETGMPESALQEIRRLYGWMSSHDPTVTFWEGIGPGGGLYEDSFTSAAHGWSTGVVSLLTNSVLGVEPISPGFRNWSVKPMPGDVSWAKGQVPTPLGSISVDWSLEGSAFTLDVVAPPSSQGVVAVPVSNSSQVILVDGQVLRAGRATGVSTARYANGYVTFPISGGQHSIMVV
ncbi:MAG: hypothetical protein M1818_005143 [Claussenomyces sp. TS43310]|nr:MAG: hypothetical protein M1818_005143 [Claussenomyces sp. TS43310]